MAGAQRYTTPEAALERLMREDAVGQLRRREGAMARLGSEDGALKLDWVGMRTWLVDHPGELAEIEYEAEQVQSRALNVIWAGMGGSVLTVRALKALGFGEGAVMLHPLDSTDPAALNSILREMNDLKDWAMIAVALGMTSEEPISHLEWFAGVLRNSGFDPTLHQTVMALPGSYLDRYALDHGLTTVSLQLNGGSGINGRMSAPGTRVFLTPVALWLESHSPGRGELRSLLRAAHDPLDLSGSALLADQWAQLAAHLAAEAVGGVVWLGLETPLGWEAVRDWTEQLMEESLGKGGKGVVVFAPDALPTGAPMSLRVRITGDTGERPGWRDGEFVVVESLIVSALATERLSGLVSLFTGLQSVMALFGYLWDIPFAGQPAVEAYKSRARALRDSAVSEIARDVYDSARLRAGELALAEPADSAAIGAIHDPATALATFLREWRRGQPLAYFDLTFNGEAEAEALATLEASLRRLAVERLGIGYKLRRAPAAYHSTEQSEMDGPAGVLSLRALPLRHVAVTAGDYSARFLEAQAVATWQAMNAARRPCFLALYDGDMSGALAALSKLLDVAAAALASGSPLI